MSVPFLSFLYHSNSSLPIPLHLGLVDTTTPLSISVLLNCSLLSSPSSFSFSPVLQCMSSCSFCLPILHVVLLPWSSAGL
jgi:hypothetical protein